MSNEDQAMIATITNSDPGRHVSTWGPFSYYEGFNSIDIVRNGGEDSGSSRISMTGYGFIEIATSSGRKLCIDEAGEVTVWQMTSGGEVRIGVDDSIAIEFGDGANAFNMTIDPDGWLDAGDVDDSPFGDLQQVEDFELANATLHGKPVPTEKGEQIDWVIEQVAGGRDATREWIAQQLGVSVRTAQHLLVEAVQKDPEAFVNVEEAKDPAADA